MLCCTVDSVFLQKVSNILVKRSSCLARLHFLWCQLATSQIFSRYFANARFWRFIFAISKSEIETTPFLCCLLLLTTKKENRFLGKTKFLDVYQKGKLNAEEVLEIQFIWRDKWGFNSGIGAWKTWITIWFSWFSRSILKK